MSCRSHTVVLDTLIVIEEANPPTPPICQEAHLAYLTKSFVHNNSASRSAHWGHDVHLHIFISMQRSLGCSGLALYPTGTATTTDPYNPKGMSRYTPNPLRVWAWLSDRELTVLECLGDTLGAIIDRKRTSSFYLHLDFKGIFRFAGK